MRYKRIIKKYNNKWGEFSEENLQRDNPPYCYHNGSMEMEFTDDGMFNDEVTVLAMYQSMGLDFTIIRLRYSSYSQIRANGEHGYKYVKK